MQLRPLCVTQPTNGTVASALHWAGRLGGGALRSEKKRENAQWIWRVCCCTFRALVSLVGWTAATTVPVSNDGAQSEHALDG